MQADGKEGHRTDAGQPLSEPPAKGLDKIPDRAAHGIIPLSLRAQSVLAGKSRDSSWS